AQATCGRRTTTPAIREPEGFRLIDAPGEVGANRAQNGRIRRGSGRARPVGLEFMRCALRPSLAGETGAGRAVVRAIAIVFALAVGTILPAEAQIFRTPQPTP